MKHIFLTLALLGISNLCTAQATAIGNYISYGAITKLSVQDEIAYLDIQSRNSNPACATNSNWDFAFEIDSPAGKAMYSMALSAYKAQLDVVIMSDDQCTFHSSIQDTTRISLGRFPTSGSVSNFLDFHVAFEYGI